MTSPPAAPIRPSWPDYRAVWRWHFYAGLFCIPFVLLLACSGTLYLFRPQVEAWIDRPYDHLANTGSLASPAAQARAAVAAVPGSVFDAYEIPTNSDAAARVLVDQAGRQVRVYVHPQTLQILHVIPEEDRFMRQVFHFHGELMAGDTGSAIVELAASWAIVMILTGLYLWWPRNSRGPAGVVYPRLFSGSRLFWRDIHSVIGVWVSAMALFMLASGLPWAKYWGDYFKTLRQVTHTAVAKQDWTNGSPAASPAGEHHGRHSTSNSNFDLAPLDAVVAAIRPLDLPAPVLISPSGHNTSHWAAKSMTANRPQRVDLMVDGINGAILSRKDFHDRLLVDRVAGVAIAMHEGQLFGWPNQLLGLLTALGLVCLCLSGLLMWWRRRDPARLGAPPPLLSPRLSLGLIALILALGLYIPFFGLSLILVLVTERVLLRRLPRLRDWLGLQNSRRTDEEGPQLA